MVKKRNVAMFLLVAGYAATVAAGNVGSSFTQFQFQLTDLDSNDGITPSLHWITGYAESIINWYPVLSPNDAGSSIDSRGGFDSNVSIGFAGSYTSKDGVVSFVTPGSGINVSTSAEIEEFFILTPKTELTFTCLAHVSAVGISESSSFIARAGLLASLEGDLDNPTMLK